MTRLREQAENIPATKQERERKKQEEYARIEQQAAQAKDPITRAAILAANARPSINHRTMIRTNEDEQQASMTWHKTFGSWALDALLNDSDEILPEDTDPTPRRVFVVSAHDEYNHCVHCGQPIANAKAHRNPFKNTTRITCPHCGYVFEFILKK